MANLKKISTDLTGMTFGSLKVRSFAGYLGSENHPKHAHWNTLCVCGEPRLVRGTRLSSGSIRSCAPCAHRLGAIKGGASRSLPATEKRLRNSFGYYRANATKKNRVFDLTENQFRKLVTDACYFCGTTPAAGIDRFNNSLGYLPSNSVPCCAICNYAKREMSEENFRNWIYRVHAHLEKKLK